jgi:hypothetical protein
VAGEALPWPCPPHRFAPPSFGLVGRDDQVAADWCGFMPLGLLGGQICGQLVDHPAHRTVFRAGPELPRCVLCGVPVARRRLPVPAGSVEVWLHLRHARAMLVGLHEVRVAGETAATS